MRYFEEIVNSILLAGTAVLLYFALTLPIISFSVTGDSIIGMIREISPSFEDMTDEDLYLMGSSFLDVDFETLSQKEDYSVISGTQKLWTQGNYFPAVLVFLFSILFPIFKLMITCAASIRGRFQPINKLLSQVHRISMLDVFVVSVIVFVLSRATGYEVAFGTGFYIYVAYFFTHMATSAIVSRFAAQPDQKEA